ncbi:SpoIIE family protein phosphatase [Catenulispora yoronensis]
MNPSAPGTVPEFPPELLAADPGSAVNALMRETAWSATALGPVHTWGPELRTAVGVCLNSPFPMLVMWGPELAMVYNDAFVPILAAKHPALGQPCAQVWSDAWPVVGEMLGEVMEHSRSTYHQDLPLMLQRHGFDETVYFTFAYSAIPTSAGVGGVFTVVTETTAQVLGTRRLGTLRELGEARSAQVTDAGQVCATAAEVLAAHREDTPFAVMYLLDADGDVARACGGFGLAGPALSAAGPLPPRVTAPAAEPGQEDDWVWQAIATGAPQTRTGLLQVLRDMVVDEAGAEQAMPVDTAVALPLSAPGTGRAHGVLVLGVNPHLALDGPYREFLQLTADHLAAAVTDARSREAALRRAEELAELDQAKSRFFAGVSHEFRTPLTLIAGPAADALADADDPLTPAQRRRVEIIGRNAGRLRRMVDTLLDFNRIQDGQLSPEPVAVPLGALTRGIAQSFAPAVRRAGLELTIDCPADADAFPVLADPGMWERIVLNLLSNAVKFTPAGSVRISLRITGQEVVLTVADTGVGIAEDELPHIFERFRQARVPGGRSHEGSGIGLALVKELAALHGGTVEAASRLGVGTVLTVRLPARPAGGASPAPASHSVVQDYMAEALQWTSAVPADLPAGAGSPAAGTAGGDTVLIAEDNADLRTYLATLLAPHYRLAVATDGREALDLARSLRPDLVLVDVMMPRLDGFELLAALRADPATSSTPVVFLSARAGQEAAAEGLAAGADDYLVKPFTSADLLARIRSNLDLARLRNHESAWRTALVNAMQDGFFVADRDLTVIEINDGFTRLLGYRASQLPWSVPHPWWPSPDTDPEGYALLETALEVIGTHGRGRFVLPLRHLDGHRRWIDVAVDSVRDRDSTGQLLVGTLRDVTTIQLAAERDAALARLARLLSGANDSTTILRLGLADLREHWGAQQATLLHFNDMQVNEVQFNEVQFNEMHFDDMHFNDTVTDGDPGPVPVATSGSAGLADAGLPPPEALTAARAGRLFMRRPLEPDAEPEDGGGGGSGGGGGGGSGEALATGIGVPLFDGTDQALLWLEFDRPRPLSGDDRILMVQLAAHLQRALGRARATDEHRRVALALQRAILGPAQLPEGFAVHYEPAGAALEVGGDWYDVVELPGNRYGVVVGDVVGRGLAAATTMGQLRSAARALLLENNGPARVLEALDRFAELLPGALCTTVFCAVIDPATHTVTYSSAGHLPALLAVPDQPGCRLMGARSTPLAVTAGTARPQSTTAIPAGSRLLVYTDGLVERRGEDIYIGIARAQAALAASSGADPGAAIDHLCAVLLDKDQRADDVALLLYHQT